MIEHLTPHEQQFATILAAHLNSGRMFRAIEDAKLDPAVIEKARESWGKNSYNGLSEEEKNEMFDELLTDFATMAVADKGMKNWESLSDAEKKNLLEEAADMIDQVNHTGASVHKTLSGAGGPSDPLVNDRTFLVNRLDGGQDFDRSMAFMDALDRTLMWQKEAARSYGNDARVVMMKRLQNPKYVQMVKESKQYVYDEVMMESSGMEDDYKKYYAENRDKNIAPANRIPLAFPLPKEINDGITGNINNWHDAFCTMPRTMGEMLAIDAILSEYREERQAAGYYTEQELNGMSPEEISEKVVAIHGSMRTSGNQTYRNLAFITGDVVGAPESVTTFDRLKVVGGSVEVHYKAGINANELERIQKGLLIQDNAGVCTNKLVGVDRDINVGDNGLLFANKMQKAGGMTFGSKVDARFDELIVIGKDPQEGGSLFIGKDSLISCPSLQGVVGNVYISGGSILSAEEMEFVCGTLTVNGGSLEAEKTKDVIEGIVIRNGSKVSLPALEDGGDIIVGRESSLTANGLQMANSVEVASGGKLETDRRWLLTVVADFDDKEMQYNYVDVHSGLMFSDANFEKAEVFENGEAAVMLNGQLLVVDEERNVLRALVDGQFQELTNDEGKVEAQNINDYANGRGM